MPVGPIALAQLSLVLAVALALAGPAQAAVDASEVLVPKDPSIQQVSGVVADPSGVGFWVNQDASAPNEIFHVAPDGENLTVLSPANTRWEDPEDIGIGPGATTSEAYLYVSDAGDGANQRKIDDLPSRREFAIARTPLPPPDAPSVTKQRFDVLRFEYPDGINLNSEAMLVDPATGDTWVVDKTREGVEAGIWLLPAAAFGASELIKATASGKLDKAAISGGAVDPQRRFVVLRDAENAYLFKVEEGQSIGAALEGIPTTVALPAQPQGEGITVDNSGTELIITSEGREQPFVSVPISAEFLSTLPPSQAQDPMQDDDVLIRLGAAILALGAVVIVVVGHRLRSRRVQRGAAGRGSS